MVEAVVWSMMIASVSALLVLPLAVCEIIRLGRKNRNLAERNAAQAAALWAGSRASAREGKAPDRFQTAEGRINAPRGEEWEQD